MKESITSAWDRKYKENIEHQTFDETTKKQLDDFISLLPKGAKVLDVGCGNGRKTDYISKKGFDATGIDSSGVAIKFAGKTFPNAAFKQGFVENLPFKKNSFDAVVSIAVLHCLSAASRKRYADEIYRVLKPGGILYMLTLAADDKTINKPKIYMHLSDASEIRKLFRSFKTIEMRHLKRIVKGKVNAIFICVIIK
ncbi:MAG: class I SAM-dependent methyltransferase [archaeon]